MSYQLIPVLSSATLNLSTINRCSFNLALHLRNRYSSLQHTVKIFDFGHFSATHRTFNVKTKSFVQVSKSMQKQNLIRSSRVQAYIPELKLYCYALRFSIFFFLLYSKCMHILFYRAKYSNFHTFQIYQLLSLGHFTNTT